MQVWILRNPNGSFRAKFHRQDADDCPGRRRGEEQGNVYVLVDIEELPEHQKACQFGTCFEGRGDDAAAVAGRGPGQRETAEHGRENRDAPGKLKAQRTNDDLSRSQGIAVGQQIEFRDLDSGKTHRLTIVAGRASAGELSSEAPVGKALLGREPGETVLFQTPSGPARRVEILSVLDDPT